MFGSELTCNSYWWIFPIFMMILCFFIMRNRRWSMMCGFGRREILNHQNGESDSAIEILDKRNAAGEINKEEYGEKKRTLTESTDFITD